MKKQTRDLKKEKGFTLIELMVAIAIVAVLATIGIVAFGATQKSARDAKARGDIEDIKKAMYLYRASTGTFCLLDSGSCTSNQQFYSEGSDGCGTTGSCFSKKIVPLLKNTPASSLALMIKVVSSDRFELHGRLENAPSSNECTPNTIDGPSASTRNYCILVQ